MRLSIATLDRLPSEVRRFGYDRALVDTGVVHLGIGAFHRAHQAKVFDAAIRIGDRRWGVVGVSLRSPAVCDTLAAQDYLYTLVERDGDRQETKVVGTLLGMLVAPESPERVVAALATPSVHLVTLTVTEKGYCLEPSTGRLLADDPDVAADLAGLDRPRTVPGFIVAGLAARRRAGLPPFTAISCDNLPHNGQRLRSAVLDLARAHDPALAEWIEREGAFPQTMVDRIVPATTAIDVADLQARFDYEDRALVRTEPFLQWVIEDRFVGERPRFEELGVQITADVAPWEEAKLRLLNGAHSAIAYLGGLAGIELVDAFVAHPSGRRFVEALWDESAATLTPPSGLDLPAYRSALMSRFSNPALRHRTRQIATDGSQKLPQRLLAPIAARRAADLPIDALGLAVAAWMRWQEARDDVGASFEVDDPLAKDTARALEGAATPTAKVRALLALGAIFPREFAEDEALVRSIVAAFAGLEQDGVVATLDRFATTTAVRRRS